MVKYTLMVQNMKFLNRLIILSLMLIAISVVIILSLNRFNGQVETTMSNVVNSIVAGFLGFLARESHTPTQKEEGNVQNGQ